MSEPFKVVIAEEVVVETARILGWWRENRPSAPELFRLELDEALVLISERPEVGTRVRSRAVRGARVVQLLRSRYRVFYVVRSRQREVLIVLIRHSSQRPLAR